MSVKRFVKDFVMGNLVRKEPVYIPKLQGELLNNRVALVTGGTSGIGFAISEAFLRNGAEVIITGRDAGRIEKATALLSESCPGGKVHGLVFDVRDAERAREALQSAIDLTSEGVIDILVNNAGVLTKTSLLSVTPEDFDKVLETNLRGAYFLSQAFADYLIKSSLQGNILNIASSSSLRPAVSPYTMSKWGIRGMTMGLARVLAPHGITVNGLAPGPTATPMLQKSTDSPFLENGRVPAGRFVAPEEIANMAVVLVSDIGKMIIGDTIYMTGGGGVVTYDDIAYSL